MNDFNRCIDTGNAQVQLIKFKDKYAEFALV